MSTQTHSCTSQSSPDLGLETLVPTSPELRHWIIEQAVYGHTSAWALDAMVAAGWDERTAEQALQTTLQSHLDEQARLQPALEAVPVPEPDLDGSPVSIDAGDRRVHVLQVMSSPCLVVFGNLLSDDECAELIEMARTRLERSTVVSPDDSSDIVAATRTSNGAFFLRGENELVSRIDRRISRLLSWAEEKGEELQVLQYTEGAEFKPHYDYFPPGEPATAENLLRGGQRVATLVMYLAEPERGGATFFPDAHLEVAPRRGNAVFFSYDQPHPSTKTLHGGAPVIAGEKWIATKWLRERRVE